MTSFKRPHTKTRLGCQRCKQRKVRCDLRPPICSNCEHRREACSYSASHASHLTRTNSHESPFARQEVHEDVSDFRPPISFELALHFDALTSSTFDLPQTPLIWRKELVRRADSQTYVRQSSLALAALHVIHLRPLQSDAPSLYRKAHDYQNKSSALFRRSVLVVDHENGPAVLAFCVMTAMFHAASSLIEYAADGQRSIDVLSPLLAFRSGALLLGSCREMTIHHESLAGSLGRFGKDASQPSTPWGPQKQAALDALGQAILRIQTAGYSTPATLHALMALRKMFTLFPAAPKGWLHVIFWPAMVPDEYIEELREDQPAAIIAFVYWCAYLNNSLQQWYLEGWPRTAALHKITKVDQRWHDILAWPRDRLDVSDPGVGECALIGHDKSCDMESQSQLPLMRGEIQL